MSLLSDALSRGWSSLLRVGGESVLYQTAGGADTDGLDVTVVWYGDRMWLRRADLSSVVIAKGDIVRRGDYVYRVVNPPESQAPYIPDGGDESADGITIYLKPVSRNPNV